MKTKNTSKAGFTLVEIMIVVAIIGLLAAIAIPNFVRARKQSQRSICINNLRMIDSAKQQWATENKKNDPDVPPDDSVAEYMKNNKFPVCPGGGKYTVGAVSVDPLCDFASTDPRFLHVLTAP